MHTCTAQCADSLSFCVLPKREPLLFSWGKDMRDKAGSTFPCLLACSRPVRLAHCFAHCPLAMCLMTPCRHCVNQVLKYCAALVLPRHGPLPLCCTLACPSLPLAPCLHLPHSLSTFVFVMIGDRTCIATLGGTAWHWLLLADGKWDVQRAAGWKVGKEMLPRPADEAQGDRLCQAVQREACSLRNRTFLPCTMAMMAMNALRCLDTRRLSS